MRINRQDFCFRRDTTERLCRNFPKASQVFPAVLPPPLRPASCSFHPFPSLQPFSFVCFSLFQNSLQDINAVGVDFAVILGDLVDVASGESARGGREVLRHTQLRTCITAPHTPVVPHALHHRRNFHFKRKTLMPSMLFTKKWTVPGTTSWVMRSTHTQQGRCVCEECCNKTGSSCRC